MKLEEFKRIERSLMDAQFDMDKDVDKDRPYAKFLEEDADSLIVEVKRLRRVIELLTGAEAIEAAALKDLNVSMEGTGRAPAHNLDIADFILGPGGADRLREQSKAALGAALEKAQKTASMQFEDPDY